MAAARGKKGNATGWASRVVYSVMFWALVLFHFFPIPFYRRKRIQRETKKSNELHFNPEKVTQSYAYRNIRQRFNRVKGQHLGAGIYALALVELSPLGSLPIVIEYLSEDLRHRPITKAAFRKVISGLYMDYLLTTRADGRDETPLLDAIEKISKA